MVHIDNIVGGYVSAVFANTECDTTVSIERSEHLRFRSCEARESHEGVAGVSTVIGLSSFFALVS